MPCKITSYDVHVATNADRIRSMSDEELADFLFELTEKYLYHSDPFGDALDWLRQPAEE